MNILACDVLFVVVTDVESRALRKAAEAKTGRKAVRKNKDAQVYRILGDIGGARCIMVRSEMGSGGLGGSQATVTNAIAHTQPKFVIMPGIAFGTKPEKQQIGQILVSRQMTNYGPRRVGDQQTIIRGTRADASPRLIQNFRASAEDLDAFEGMVDFGLMLSGPDLIDNLTYRQELLELEPEAIGGEMEGAGVYTACQEKKVEWIIAKAICDFADGNKGEGKAEKQERAARNAATFVVEAVALSGLGGDLVKRVPLDDIVAGRVQLTGEPARYKVFVSCHDEDRGWFDRFERMAKPLQRQKKFAYVHADSSRADRGTEGCKLALLFLSNAYLASDTIMEEVRMLLERGVHPFPIRVGRCELAGTALEGKTAANKIYQDPLNALAQYEPERELLEMARLLGDMVEKLP